MTAELDRIEIGDGGNVEVAGDRARLRLSLRRGPYDLALDTPTVLMLRRADTSGQRVLLCGEICRPSSVLDAINMAIMLQLRGELWIQESRDDEARTRIMAIESGALRSARSNVPSDRLGEVLAAEGLVSRQQVEQALEYTSPEMRLGEVLMEHGVLSHEQLYLGLQRQAQRIFFESIVVHEGQFVFIEDNGEQSVPDHLVSLPLQSLLLEGVQRIDETAVFREAIPRDDLVMYRTGAELPSDATQTSRDVLTYCNGDASLAEIARATALGLFPVLKEVYSLLQLGIVVVAEPVDRTEQQLNELLEQLGAGLHDIYQTVAAYGRPGSALTIETALRHWVSRSDYDQSLLLSHDGPSLSLDSEGCLAFLLQLPAEQALSHAKAMFSDVSSFALFIATTMLPRQHEEVLSRKLNVRLRHVDGTISVHPGSRPSMRLPTKY